MMLSLLSLLSFLSREFRNFSLSLANGKLGRRGRKRLPTDNRPL